VISHKPTSRPRSCEFGLDSTSGLSVTRSFSSILGIFSPWTETCKGGIYEQIFVFTGRVRAHLFRRKIDWSVSRPSGTNPRYKRLSGGHPRKGE